VRFRDLLKHPGGGSRRVGYRNEHHLLLLHDSKTVVVKALARRIQVGRQHVDDPIHLRVPVDVDSGCADASDGGGQHARSIGCERNRQIRGEARYGIACARHGCTG
jgi:hypothetical protein